MNDAIEPLFAVGDRVTVLAQWPHGHIRTPIYCRGHSGVIERLCGHFPNPEELAFGLPGLPLRPLYRVRFRSRDLWPDYAEGGDDVVEIEIYQHWLEPAGQAALLRNPEDMHA